MVLDTDMNGHHCFNLYSEKLSHKVLTPTQVTHETISNFHFDPPFNLSQGEVYDFSRKVQNKLRGDKQTLPLHM
jgi:hypothetical protein